MMAEIANKAANAIKDVISSRETIEWISSIVVILTITFMKSLRMWITRKLKQILRIHTPITGDTVQPLDAINQSLYGILHNTGADRVSVYQFHNGESFSMANPIFKLTCSHEVIDPGLRYEFPDIKSVCISNMVELCLPLLDKETQLHAGISELKLCKKHAGNKTCGILPVPLRVLHFHIDKMKYCFFKDVMNRNGVHHVFATLLYSREKKPLGLMLMQYMDKDFPSQSSLDICGMCNTVLEVQFRMDSLR